MLNSVELLKKFEYEWQDIDNSFCYTTLITYIQDVLHIEKLNILSVIDVLWKKEYDLNIATNISKLENDEDYCFEEQIVTEIANIVNSICTKRIEKLDKKIIEWYKDVLRSIQFVHNVKKEFLISYDTQILKI